MNVACTTQPKHKLQPDSHFQKRGSINLFHGIQNATITQQTLQSNIMNIEEKKLIKEETKELLCVSCQRFYGNPAFNQMCSQCYKKNQQTITPKKGESQKVELPVLAPKKEQSKGEEEKQEVNKDRCSTCSRKLKLLGIECRCGKFFCNSHRLPEDHGCGFNHKNMGKEALSKQVFKVDKAKISSI